MQKKIIAHKYTLLLAIGISLVTIILVNTKPEPVFEPVELPPLKVDITQVVRKDIHPEVLVGGILRPVRRAELQFQVAGRVLTRHVEPGQKVKQGEALLTLEEGDFKDAMIEARARLDQEQFAVERDQTLLKLAERNRALQEDEVKRQQRLGSDSLSSRASLDAARQRLLQLQGEEQHQRFSVDSAESRIAIMAATARRAERNWQRTQLEAPFAGTVNKVMPEAGDDVAARDSVVELLQLAELDFYAEVERAVAASLKVGQSIDVFIDDKVLTATMVALQQDPDPLTYTYSLRARFENPGVLSGMAVDGLLKLPPLSEVVVIPVSAVVRDDGDTFLYVLDPQSKTVMRRDVKLGLRQGDELVVLSGLDGAEQIVRRGGSSLDHGQRVTF
ncbi:efflux RND transporter periplasmic adaptor subunit [Pseudomonadota bacterium]